MLLSQWLAAGDCCVSFTALVDRWNCNMQWSSYLGLLSTQLKAIYKGKEEFPDSGKLPRFLDSASGQQLTSNVQYVEGWMIREQT